MTRFIYFLFCTPILGSLVPYDYCDAACRPNTTATISFSFTPTIRFTAEVSPTVRPDFSFQPEITFTIRPEFTLTVLPSFPIPPNPSFGPLPCFGPLPSIPIPFPPVRRVREASASSSPLPVRRLQEATSLPPIPAYASCVPQVPPTSLPSQCLPYGLNPSDPPPSNLTDCCGLGPKSKLICERKVLSEDPRFKNLTVTCASGSLPYAVTDFPVCPRGFTCLGMDASDSTTWPQICTPTIECQLTRLTSLWCEAQGLFEPEICPPGSYCPNGSAVIVCPLGHYCVRGSTLPRRCPAMSLCPQGTNIATYYGGVLLAGLFDLVLVVLFLLNKNLWGPNLLKKKLKRRREGLLASAQLFKGVGDHKVDLDNGFVSSMNPLRDLLPKSKEAFEIEVNSAHGSASVTSNPSLRAANDVDGPRFGYETSETAQRQDKTDPLSSKLDVGGTSGGVESNGMADEDAAAAQAAASILTKSFIMCNKGLSLSLSFVRLSLHIPPPINKTILSSVSGSIRPGRVTAIMGPSGAGKTTFLSVLLAKVRRTGGSLTINGSSGELVTYGRVIGFVPQEDVMLRELTVRENILHSARVRLPRADWGPKRVYRLVDAVIEVLGLASCADTLTERISGGQRKRVNIGMELATAPSAIFLDEPTSGLDSTAALQVCNTLKNIATLGVTVVAVIHQPRNEIFRSFDDLLLLAPGGKTVYAGPGKDALGYFEDLGLSFSASSSSGNPADDILDFIAGERELEVPEESVVSARKGAIEESKAEDAAEQQSRKALNSLSPLSLSYSHSSPIEDSSPRRSSRFNSASSPVLDLDVVAATSDSLVVNPPPLHSFYISSPHPSPSPSVTAPHFVKLKGKDVPAYLADKWYCSPQYRASQGSLSTALSSPGGPSKPTFSVNYDGGASNSDGVLSEGPMMSSVQHALQNRGAPLFRQFLLCLLRSLLQQSRRATWLLLELGVSTFAGSLMGLASTGVKELYSGILKPPMTPVSPAPNVSILPALGFYIAMAAGLAASPAAVRTFGEERDLYLREIAGHHSSLAYFLGKVVGDIPRLTLASLHFSGFFIMLARPASDFTSIFIMVWGLYFGVYGLSALMSSLVDRANGALLGTLASLIFATMSGYGPNLIQGREWGIFVVQELSYSRWASELFLHFESLPYREIFLAEDIPAGVFGYTLDRPMYDITMMILMGVILRVLSFVSMIFLVGGAGVPSLSCRR